MKVIRHPALASDIREVAMHYAEISEILECEGMAFNEKKVAAASAAEYVSVRKKVGSGGNVP